MCASIPVVCVDFRCGVQRCVCLTIVKWSGSKAMLASCCSEVCSLTQPALAKIQDCDNAVVLQQQWIIAVVHQGRRTAGFQLA
mmetsp:Transcript_2615/g.5238  ORF Transcript_2615/g.5238 Transcript_2615/m.5238 type:complete len:83 (+) Transcript_2615:142-390(+)